MSVLYVDGTKEEIEVLECTIAEKSSMEKMCEMVWNVRVDQVGMASRKFRSIIFASIE